VTGHRAGIAGISRIAITAISHLAPGPPGTRTQVRSNGRTMVYQNMRTDVEPRGATRRAQGRTDV
jgi:hypothetical protein